jgi:hypothetical protein
MFASTSLLAVLERLLRRPHTADEAARALRNAVALSGALAENAAAGVGVTHTVTVSRKRTHRHPSSFAQRRCARRWRASI